MMNYSAARIIRNTASITSLLVLLSCAFLSLLPGSAAQRTTPRLVARDYFIGKIVLIPRDVRPASWQQPRLIAQVADHDLLVPPSRLLEDSSRTKELIAWAKSVDYVAADGLIEAFAAVYLRALVMK